MDQFENTRLPKLFYPALCETFLSFQRKGKGTSNLEIDPKNSCFFKPFKKFDQPFIFLMLVLVWILVLLLVLLLLLILVCCVGVGDGVLVGVFISEVVAILNAILNS